MGLTTSSLVPLTLPSFWALIGSACPSLTRLPSTTAPFSPGSWMGSWTVTTTGWGLGLAVGLGSYLWGHRQRRSEGHRVITSRPFNFSPKPVCSFRLHGGRRAFLLWSTGLIPVDVGFSGLSAKVKPHVHCLAWVMNAHGHDRKSIQPSLAKAEFSALKHFIPTLHPSNRR